jgi:hypothetical protein
LAGFAGKDLVNSAKGRLDFDWRKGAITGRSGTSTEILPSAVTRFDHWTGEFEIANGAVTLKENQVQQGPRKETVNASITFGEPPKVSFGQLKNAAVAKK